MQIDLQNLPFVEIILAVTGFVLSRSVVEMTDSIKELTHKLETISIEFASFTSKTETILEQHDRDIADLKRATKD